MKPTFLKNFTPGASKFQNKKVTIDGIIFDSAKEARVYSELIVLQKTYEIISFERQKTYELIPAQRDENGKTIERACTYKADFVVYHNDESVTVIDAKGFRDQKYPIKRKLMLWVYKIRICEV